MKARDYNVVPFSLKKGLTKFNVLEGSWRKILKKDKDRNLSDRELQLLWTLLRLSNHYGTTALELDYEFLMRECQFGCSQPQMRRYIVGLREAKVINYNVVKQPIGYDKKLVINIDINSLKTFLPSIFDEQVCKANLQGYIVKNKKIEKEIEDSSLRAISSISREKKKKEKENEAGSLLTDLTCCGAASQSSSLSDESRGQKKQKEEARAATRSQQYNPELGVKTPEGSGKSESLEKQTNKRSEGYEQPSARIIPLTAKIEQELHKQRLYRTSSNSSSSSEDGEGFTLIADLLKGVELLQAPPELPKATKPSNSDTAPSENLTNIALNPLNQGAESVQANPMTSETLTELTTTKEENDTMAVPLKHTTSDLWERIRQEALASLEHEVDRWDLKFEFNQLEVTEDTENSLFELKGSKSVITNIRKNHFKAFTEAFYKVTTNHTFVFIEAL